MKNLFKYLSVAALVGSIGFSTMGVNAATNLTSINNELTCKSNQTLKRDYMMFLDVNGKGFFNGLSADNKTKVYRTTGEKYNQVPNSGTFVQHAINIVDGSKTTVGETTAAKPWTAEEYWTKYAIAINSDAYDATRLLYQEGDETYVFHSGWDVLDTESNTVMSSHEENKVENNKLNNYLKDTAHIKELAEKATVYPSTINQGPLQLLSNGIKNADWVVKRTYNPNVADGVEGVSLEEGGAKKIYSPFVVYVEYCVANGSGDKDPDPVANKELKYVKNIDAEVTDMPTDETFEDKTKVSTSVPKATGYRFLGWSTKKEDTTADEKYKAGSEITESTTLYAIWQKSDGTFTVTYDANGGKNAPAKDSAKDGSCLKISDKKPTQTGFNFLGWSTKKDAQEPDKKYAAGADYCGDAGNVTLYAVWQTRTGVSAHLIAFGTVALAAAGALVVAKKKNLFRQI